MEILNIALIAIWHFARAVTDPNNMLAIILIMMTQTNTAIIVGVMILIWKRGDEIPKARAQKEKEAAKAETAGRKTLPISGLYHRV